MVCVAGVDKVWCVLQELIMCVAGVDKVCVLQELIRCGVCCRS